MSDSFTEYSSDSKFDRIKESIKGLLFGLVLFVVSFPVLWLNEKNSAETIAGLNQLLGETVTVEANVVLSEHEGRPVHITGAATTDNTLTDGQFGVSVNAVKLIREVEMYQWRETEETHNSKTTYTYEKVWSEDPIASGDFHPRGREEHTNPTMPYRSASLQAGDVKLGAFELSPFLVSQMNNSEPLVLSTDQRKALPADLRATLRDEGSGYYQGNSGSPQIGDLRINFFVVNPDTVSIVARQTGNTFENYVAANGKGFALLETGALSKENVIQAAQSRNSMRTWLFRGVGVLLMFFGLALLVRPLTVLASIVPLVGGLVNAGVWLICAVVAAGFSLLTVSVAWVTYRPLLGFPLAGVSMVLIGYAVFRINTGKRRKGRKKKVAEYSRHQPPAAQSYLDDYQPAPPPVIDEIKVACLACGQHIQCDASYAGMEIDCPACTAKMQIPSSPSPSPAVEQIVDSHACPKCGAVIAPNGDNCPNCGFNLKTDMRIHPQQSAATSRAKEQLPPYELPTRSETGLLGMYAQLQATAQGVGALPELKQQRPGRWSGFKSFFVRSGRAFKLIFTEKELIMFGLLQWAVIGIVYYLWVQILGWIPEETWENARQDDGVSTVEIVFVVWSLLCIGVAAFPLGILTGCMGAVTFLNRQGEESTVARCLGIVMPRAVRLWIFHWIDGAYTCKQILERLRSKRDEGTPRRSRALSEALYYAWKLGTAGVMPGLVMGKSLIGASKGSIRLVKDRFFDLALLRTGYSVLCWLVGVLAYVGSLYFFWATDFFSKPEGLKEGAQIHQFFQLAGVPLLVAVGAVLLLLRPLYLISLCDIYAEQTEEQGEALELGKAPGRGTSALVAFALLVVIVSVGGLYVKPYLARQGEQLAAAKPSQGFTSPESVFEAMKPDPEAIGLLPPEERPLKAYTMVAMARLMSAFETDEARKKQLEQGFTDLITKHHLSDSLEFSATEDPDKIRALADQSFANVDLDAFWADLWAYLNQPGSAMMTEAEAKPVTLKDLKNNGDEARGTVVNSDETEVRVVFVKSGGGWFLSFAKTHMDPDDPFSMTTEMSLLVTFDSDASLNAATARGLLDSVDYDRSSTVSLERAAKPLQAYLTFMVGSGTDLEAIAATVKRAPGVREVRRSAGKEFDEGMSEAAGEFKEQLKEAFQNGEFEVNRVEGSTGSSLPGAANRSLPTGSPSSPLPDPGSLQAYRGMSGRQLFFNVRGASAGPLWGTDTYTDDSQLTVAAVHAGVLSPGQTGVVQVAMLPGQSAYQGSERNGVRSGPFGNWVGSFRVEAPVAGQDLQEANRLLKLDGRNGYFELPPNTFGNLTEATIECRVKWDRFQYMSRVFDLVIGKQLVAVMNRDRSPNLYAEAFVGGRRRTLEAPGTLRPNQWIHLALVVEPSQLKAYIDGAPLLATATDNPDTYRSGEFSRRNLVGFSNAKPVWTDDEYFAGQIDEIHVWNRALTGAEIKDAMDRKLNGKEIGLVGWWTFDDPAAPGRDYSPGGHHGLLKGGSTLIPQGAESGTTISAGAAELPGLVARSARDPSDTLLALQVAALQVWFDQDEAYEQTRKRMLAWAARKDDPAVAERVAKTASLKPSVSILTQQEALNLARKAVTRGAASSDLPWFQMALGMAEFRLSHQAAADQALRNAINGARTFDATRRSRVHGTCNYYRVMNMLQQGRRSEALELFRQTETTMLPPPGNKEDLVVSQVNHDDLIVWLAHREAAKLLNVPGQMSAK